MIGIRDENSGYEQLQKIRINFKEVNHISWDMISHEKKTGLLWIAFQNPTLEIILEVINEVKKYVTFKDVHIRAKPANVEKVHNKFIIEDIPIEDWIESDHIFFPTTKHTELYKQLLEEKHQELDKLKQNDDENFHKKYEEYKEYVYSENLKLISIILVFIKFTNIKLD